MEHKIGLTAAEIDGILERAIAYGKTNDAKVTREVIAEAIVKNNEKLLQDIMKLMKS